MKAAIYARDTRYKTNRDFVEKQIQECCEFAKNNGYTVVGEYIDDGLSASVRDEKRSGFLSMIFDGRQKKFDAVIVSSQDRFDRNRDADAYYRNRLREHGVEVIVLH